ncbi:MAG: extracellular solute-binding protein [Anaerolineae bacterium]
MESRRLNRRVLLRSSLMAAGAALLASCQRPATPTALPAPTQAPAETAVPPTTAPPPTAQPEPAPAKPVTISFWDFPRNLPAGTDQIPWMEQEFVAPFNKVYPHITVELTALDWASGAQKLDVALAAGDPPDIVSTYFALFAKILALDVIEPIDDYLAEMDAEDVADFYEAVWKAHTVDGHVMQWPYSFTTSGEWLVNKSVARDAGAIDLLPKAPDYGWTPDQFVEFGRQVITLKRDDRQAYALMLHLNEQIGIAIWSLMSLGVAFGAELCDFATGRSEYGNEKGVRAMQFIYDLVEKHKVAPPGPQGLTGAHMIDEWWANRIACRLGDIDVVIQEAKVAAEKGTIEFSDQDLLPVLPIVEQGETLRVIGGSGGYSIFKQKDTDRLKAAMALGRFLTSREIIEMTARAGYNKITPRKSVTDKLAAGDPVVEWRIKYVFPNVTLVSRHPETMKIWDAWMHALQAMFTGSLSPAKAAKSFEDEVNKIVRG